MNTSASLDGLILDKPGIQLVLDRNKNVQTDLGHMPYILNSKAMEIATNYKELVHVLNKIVNGIDTKKQIRKNFIKEFIRPFGMKQKSSEIFLEKLLNI